MIQGQNGESQNGDSSSGSNKNFTDSMDRIRPIPLAFSFSLAVEQNSLQSGTLLAWCKRFRNTTGVGEDIVRLLQNSLRRRKVFLYICHKTLKI